MVHKRDEDIALLSEVEVERSLADTGRHDDLRHRGLVEAHAAEDGLRGVEELLARLAPAVGLW